MLWCPKQPVSRKTWPEEILKLYLWAASKVDYNRNAKAQARHRAKRKAYIEQLEQTVTKLQTALGFSPDQVAALPPPLMKIRELEQENARLQRENDEMRRLLSDPTRTSPLEMTRRTSLSTYQETRACDRDFKRRKMGIDDLYMSPTDPTPHNHDMARPPPLTIPQPMTHNTYSSHSSHNGSASMFNIHGPTFQMPDTPSGSSATSSPPFSPAQMQPTTNSPVQQRPSMTGHQYYGSVKMEDENYVSPNHHPPTQHTQHYSLPPFGHASTGNDMDTWQAYSSGRSLHR